MYCCYSHNLPQLPVTLDGVIRFAVAPLILQCCRSYPWIHETFESVRKSILIFSQNSVVNSIIHDNAIGHKPSVSISQMLKQIGNRDQSQSLQNIHTLSTFSNTGNSLTHNCWYPLHVTRDRRFARLRRFPYHIGPSYSRYFSDRTVTSVTMSTTPVAVRPWLSDCLSPTDIHTCRRLDSLKLEYRSKLGKTESYESAQLLKIVTYSGVLRFSYFGFRKKASQIEKRRTLVSTSTLMKM